MNKQQKKRLCWNCEGNVSETEEICPYCGVSVVPASLDGPIQGWKPPYQLEAHDNAIPSSPYQTSKNLKIPEDSENKEEQVDTSVSEFKNILIALLFLIGGSMFFLFGLTLALFSHNGIFTLQWDGSLWFIYSIISIPLLILGWRFLLKLDEEGS